MDLLNPPFIIAILVALTVHEFAHAFVADRLGDRTPRTMGRLTLNPIAHLDPMGTLLFFLVHFGWGKPVPIDPRNFKHWKRDSALTALAGPASNLLLAVLSFLLLRFLAPEVMQVGSATDLLSTTGLGERLHAFLIQVLAMSLFINLGLMAFNLLPVPPLDGANILHAFIPLRYEENYLWFMQRGPFILIALLILERLFNVPILITWITWIVDGVLRVLMLFS